MAQVEVNVKLDLPPAVARGRDTAAAQQCLGKLTP